MTPQKRSRQPYTMINNGIRPVTILENGEAA